MTTKGAILRAIRENCLSCCCGSVKEVETCNVGNNQTSSVRRCQLYPYRMGKDPLPSKTKGFKKSTRAATEILDNHTELRIEPGSRAQTGAHES